MPKKLYSPVYRSYDMRLIDEKTISDYFIAEEVLMENAALAVFNEIQKIPFSPAEKIIVLCGPGNNGGDGFAAARHLFNNGYNVKTVYCSQPEKLKGAALKNFEILKKTGADIILITSEDELNAVKKIFSECDIIIDALLGTGLKGDVKGFFELLILYANDLKKYVISVDIPSGLSADSAKANTAHIKAGVTVTFGFLKPVHVLEPALFSCGKIIRADISIPEKITSEIKTNLYLVNGDILRCLPEKQKNFHKASTGKTAVIGGSPGMTGAVILASLAALRSGCGYVKAIVPRSINSAVETGLIEAVSVPVDEKDGFFCGESVNQTLKAIEDCSAIVIGNGMGRADSIHQFLKKVLMDYKGKVILDGDALHFAAADLTLIQNSKAEIILTPHLGELSKLLNKNIISLKQDILKLCYDFSVNYNVNTAVKSSRSFFVTKKGDFYFCQAGSPALATMGSGDVLAGITLSFLNYFTDIKTAVNLAVYVHARLGEILEEKYGTLYPAAGDMIRGLKEVYNAPYC